MKFLRPAILSGMILGGIGAGLGRMVSDAPVAHGGFVITAYVIFGLGLYVLLMHSLITRDRMECKMRDAQKAKK